MILSQFFAIFPNFRRKMAFYSKTNVMAILCKTSNSWSRKRHFSANFFGAIILKIITLVPV
jgi:hypothetical protein